MDAFQEEAVFITFLFFMSLLTRSLLNMFIIHISLICGFYYVIFHLLLIWSVNCTAFAILTCSYIPSIPQITTEKHRMSFPETVDEILDVSEDEGAYVWHILDLA